MDCGLSTISNRLSTTNRPLPLTHLHTATIPAASSFGEDILIGDVVFKGFSPIGLDQNPNQHHPHQSQNPDHKTPNCFHFCFCFILHFTAYFQTSILPTSILPYFLPSSVIRHRSNFILPYFHTSILPTSKLPNFPTSLLPHFPTSP